METTKQNEKVHDYLYRKRYSLKNIGNCSNKNVLLTLNPETKINKRLNKDIMHLIKDEIENGDKNDITIEENIKYEYNASNKQSSIILPFIKLNDLLINPISSLNTKKSQKNEDSKKDLKKDSNFMVNKVSERENSLEKLNKKNYSKTSVINCKINIPNLNLNKDKNIIKRNLNINSMINTMIIDNKIENKKFCPKAKIIKNKDILEKKIEFKNHQYFNNINNNLQIILTK